MGDRLFRARLLPAIAGLAVILGACTGSTPTAAPTRATTSPAATATSAPSTVTAPSTATSPSPSVGVAPIPDGTYRTNAIPVSAIIARIKSDTTLTAEEQANLQGYVGHQTDVIALDFHAGQFTESDSLDGAPFEAGTDATYAFPDDHTLVIQEECCGLSTFVITPKPGGFSLKYKAGAPNAGEDIIGQAIYETSPFTLVP